MYRSSLRKCSAINSTASVALEASGDNKIESELSLSLLQLSAPTPTPISEFNFLLILQLGWCRSDNSITSTLLWDSMELKKNGNLISKGNTTPGTAQTVLQISLDASKCKLEGISLELSESI